jgi:hypothetical protein
MAATMYIVVEGEDPGFDIFVNGRALAANEDALEKIATRLGVKPLLDFFSADVNSMALLMDEGAGDPELVKTLPPPQWFLPADGLTTVRALLREFRRNPTTLGSNTLPIVAELEEYENVLEKAANHRSRWHLAVSWR